LCGSSVSCLLEVSNEDGISAMLGLTSVPRKQLISWQQQINSLVDIQGQKDNSKYIYYEIVHKVHNKKKMKKKTRKKKEED